MKKFTTSIYNSFALIILILVLAGCANEQEETEANPEQEPALEEETTSQDEQDDESSTADRSENDATDETDTTEETTSTTDTENDEPNSANDSALSAYSSEEIEYARVWLQLGDNQDIEAVDVTRIPAGTSLNPGEEDIDVSYPEDVIQLRGSRIVDGMITYSGNGDGTINVYNIPYRWYGGLSRPDNVTADDIQQEREEIIENTELVEIDPGNDEEVINIIDKLYMQ
ncbi:hypothetical protein [Gracilibacillus timonensis]|uniref:hypothetical protein n=1 Tax=Gracilibacillus timonensis TaxID=1816696 RepID=UPI000824A48C|nr:hypothetical protein [Gracilibacillus timonensis]